MSKSAKSEQPLKKKTPKKVKAKDKNEADSTGRLIAVEGTRGKDLNSAVERLARQFGRNGGAGWSA